MPRRQFDRADPTVTATGAQLTVFTLAGATLLLVVGALAGLAGAAALFGHGFVWPRADHVQPVLRGLLTGHPGRGLPAGQAAKVPAAHQVYGCVAVAEALLLTAAGYTAAVWARNRRPGDARGGMATRAEATAVLGRRRLRQAAPLIRPDLYGKAADKKGSP